MERIEAKQALSISRDPVNIENSLMLERVSNILDIIYARISNACLEGKDEISFYHGGNEALVFSNGDEYFEMKMLQEEKDERLSYKLTPAGKFIVNHLEQSGFSVTICNAYMSANWVKKTRWHESHADF
jgi:hypothetical protein